MAIYLGKNVNDSGDYFFLSYKKEDADILTEIVSKFGFDVWYDYGLNGGDESWSEVISNHLEKSKAVIFFLSKALLKHGDKSFPVMEYKTALRKNKKIIIVYIEEIDENKDIPNSLDFWYQDVISRQCIGYGRSLSTSELTREIEDSVNLLLSSGSTARSSRPISTIQPKELKMNLFSSSTDNSIMYLGLNDAHLSSDMSRICLYNRSNKMFEVRDTDNINFTITAFSENPENLTASRIFYSPHNRYVYYIKSNKVHIYDIEKRKWNSSFFSKGENIKLSKDECIYSIAEPKAGNITYLMLRSGKCFTRLIEYDLEKDKCNADWNLAPFNFCTVSEYFKNNSMNLLLFCNTNNELCVLDLQNKKIFKVKDNPDFIQVIQNYFNQDNQKAVDVNNLLSHDGSLYSVEFNGGFEVISTQLGTNLCTIFEKNYQNVYLLKNSVVLSLDKNGTVICETFEGRQEIFTRKYFAESPVFNGNIPHTMLYDEVNGNYIFVVSEKTPKGSAHKIVVVDKLHRTVSVSSLMTVPFSNISCTCKISKDKLFVIFCSPNNRLNNQQSTVIYMCRYN